MTERENNAEIPFLKGTRGLRPDEISFDDDAIVSENLLNFYVPIYFDVEAVLGAGLLAEDSDDYINVYANYDLEHDRVCDVLDVILVRYDESEAQYQYRLSAEERAVLLQKMESYCKDNVGESLSEIRAEFMEEQSEKPSVLGRLAVSRTQTKNVATPEAPGKANEPEL